MKNALVILLFISFQKVSFSQSKLIDFNSFITVDHSFGIVKYINFYDSSSKYPLMTPKEVDGKIDYSFSNIKNPIEFKLMNDNKKSIKSFLTNQENITFLNIEKRESPIRFLSTGDNRVTILLDYIFYFDRVNELASDKQKAKSLVESSCKLISSYIHDNFDKPNISYYAYSMIYTTYDKSRINTKSFPKNIVIKVPKSAYLKFYKMELTEEEFYASCEVFMDQDSLLLQKIKPDFKNN